jgi:hypothetical protein
MKYLIHLRQRQLLLRRPVPKIKAFYDAAAIKVLVLETVVTVLYPLSFPFVILMVFTAPIRAAFFDNLCKKVRLVCRESLHSILLNLHYSLVFQ